MTDSFEFGLEVLFQMDQERRKLSREEWDDLAWTVKASDPRAFNLAAIKRMYDSAQVVV